jgi:hypothetical protein
MWGAQQAGHQATGQDQQQPEDREPLDTMVLMIRRVHDDCAGVILQERDP